MPAGVISRDPSGVKAGRRKKQGTEESAYRWLDTAAEGGFGRVAASSSAVEKEGGVLSAAAEVAAPYGVLILISWLPFDTNLAMCEALYLCFNCDRWTSRERESR
jgi:hypothetical protein